MTTAAVIVIAILAFWFWLNQPVVPLKPQLDLDSEVYKQLRDEVLQILARFQDHRKFTHRMLIEESDGRPQLDAELSECLAQMERKGLIRVDRKTADYEFYYSITDTKVGN